jgi:hypothetical protein
LKATCAALGLKILRQSDSAGRANNKWVFDLPPHAHEFALKEVLILLGDLVMASYGKICVGS